MTKLIVLILMFLLFVPKALALHVTSPEAGINFTTSKVATISGNVDSDSLRVFMAQMAETASLPGDRVVIVDTSGGDVFSGQSMINAIEQEMTKGTRVICIGNHKVASMGFNLLSRCSARLSTSDTTFLFHKMADTDFDKNGPRLTPKQLRRMARSLEAQDEVYRKANAKALNMSLPDYDSNADKDIYWDSSALLSKKYLSGLCTLQK